MNILGIAFLSDASACVLKDGEIISAVSEERINRIKLWHGVPHKAIEQALKLADISIDDIDLIATHGEAPLSPNSVPFEEKEESILASDLSDDVKKIQLDSIRSRYEHECRVLGQRTPKYLDEIKSYGKPVIMCSHHTAHAASTYYGSGIEQSYILTADGWGEDASATLWHAKNGNMEQISYSNTFDSLGYFYGSITKALGFIPHRHEGKVLGLAAYCKNPKSYPTIRGMITCDTESRRFVSLMQNGYYKPGYANKELEDYVKNFDREDIAASAQNCLEETVCELVNSLEGKKINICLAGGIFANVKLNQRIRELENVSEVYVFPNMGDGGLSVGAAYYAYWTKTSKNPAPLTSVFQGNELTSNEIEDELQKSGLTSTKDRNISKTVATLLAEGNVVMRASGRMEFGPRALGNRSILYKANEKAVNTWLNEKLNRSEFMPFAPATLEDRAQEYYVGLNNSFNAARFMTMTYDCTQKMLEECPAAVHIDNTARPQLVSKEHNPGFHEILQNYLKLTGIPSVINTSFNMHEEPIVCTAKDAIRAFCASGLPWLALGDYIVKNPQEIFSE